MTDEQQIIEIAKLDGRRVDKIYEGRYFECVPQRGSPDDKWDELLYLHSRDAILSVIEKVANSNFETPARIWWGIDEWLEKQGVIPALKATARQLCEGLLRLVGKWQDEPKERKV